MNQPIIRICLFSLSIGGICFNANAQRTSKNDQKSNAQNPPVNQQPASKPPITNLDPTIPVRYDTLSESDVTARGTMRIDHGYNRDSSNDRIPLPYEHLRWDDALYAEKVWRELDLREKMNQTFRYQGTDDNGSQMFIDILLKAVKSGKVAAFSPVDDRFTTQMNPSEITSMTQGSLDTTAVPYLEDPQRIKEYVITRSSFDPKSVTKLRIKEEWVFDREASRMFCRIIGIAPLKTQYNANGTERGSSVMFWVYYPDLRPVLANYEVYNAKNQGYGSMTWEELFEARMFSSYIVKSTLDNPGNKTVRQMFKDPMVALREGDNVRERIFNYEQDLWSY